jgi:hypothetical protein
MTLKREALLASIASLPLLTVASAAGANAASQAEPLSIEASPRNVVYLELLGKGGVWGLGYERLLGNAVATGAALSFSVAGSETVISASPYLGVYPFAEGRHRWFLHAGPQAVHSRTRSNVPEWPGTSSTRFGAQLSTGYERRGPLVFRAYGMLVAGDGGLAPWTGLSLGWGFR